QDLYYRLHVMSFHLPPLRQRPQDIAPLVRSLTARFNQKFRKGLFEIRPETMMALEAFAWPGNIRQLENVIQHAVLISSGRELLLGHLPVCISHIQSVQGGHAGCGSAQTLRHHRERLERDLIQRTLASSDYCLTRAADLLGVSRVTLHKKMKKYGLRPS